MACRICNRASECLWLGVCADCIEQAAAADLLDVVFPDAMLDKALRAPKYRPYTRRPRQVA